MPPIKRKLSLRMRGEDVKLVHDFLERSGYRIPSDEKKKKYFGAKTRDAVMDFQKKNSLRINGVVGKATAEKMSQLSGIQPISPKPSTPEEKPGPGDFRVSGTVIDTCKNPLKGLYVVAEEKLLPGNRNRLGDSTTDQNGCYAISYNRSLLNNKDSINFYVSVFKAENTSTELTRSPLILNASEDETINLIIGDTNKNPFIRKTEYELLSERLDSIIKNKDYPVLTEQDIIFISNSTQIKASNIAYYINAKRLAIETKLDPEIFYGLFCSNLPSNLAHLLIERPENIKKAIKSAIEMNIINPKYKDDADKIIKAFSDYKVKLIFENAKPEDQPEFLKMMDIIGIKKENQKKVIRLTSEKRESRKEFWNAVENELGNVNTEKLMHLTRICVLTQNNFPLVTKIVKNKQVTRFRDLVRFKTKKWETLVKDAGIYGVKNDDPEYEKKERDYIKNIETIIERAFPTAVLARDMDEERKDESAKMFVNFVNDNPDFELKYTKIRHYLFKKPTVLNRINKKKRTEFVKELYVYQRIFNLIPENATDKSKILCALREAKYDSAIIISRTGKSAFVNSIGKKIGDYILARRIYSNARKRSAIALLLYSKYAESLHNIPLHVIEPFRIPKKFEDLSVDTLSKYDSEKKEMIKKTFFSEPGIPNLKTLFGADDAFECTPYDSVLSPTAYLVDLLFYLYNIKNTDGSRNVRELLHKRRPDIEKINLNSKNTFTAMPYIDLVIEIFENVIAGHDDFYKLPEPDGENYVSQTELTTDELKAFPEHINPEVYNHLYPLKGTPPVSSPPSLSGSSGDTPVYFPWIFPFNFWWEEAKVYLEHLKINRFRIMELFHNEENLPALAENDLSYYNMIAAEYLGITLAEERIIAGCLESSTESISTELDTLQNIDSYLKKIQLSTDRQKAFDMFLELLLSDFITPHHVQITYPGGDKPVCNLVEANIELGDDKKGFFDRLHRFVRLMRRTAWSVIELDKVLRALSITNGTGLDQNAVQDISYIKRLQQELNVPLETVLSWFSNLDTKEYKIKDVDYPSLYKQLFLNQTVNNPNAKIFNLNTALTELEDVNESFLISISDDSVVLDDKYSQLILAGLNIDAEELLGLVREEIPDPKVINLSNLSHLYRIASFTRAMKISIRDYLALKAMLKPQDSTDNQDYLLWCEKWKDLYEKIEEIINKKIKKSGFKIDELDYLLRHNYRSDFPLLPQDTATAIMLTELRKELSQVSKYNLTEPIPLTALNLLLADILTLEPENETLQKDAEKIITGSSELSKEDRKNFIDNHPEIFPDTSEAKRKLIEGDLINEQNERILYVLSKHGMDNTDDIIEYILKMTKTNMVYQKFSAELKADIAAIKLLMGIYIKIDNDVTIQLFMDENFIMNEDEITRTGSFEKYFNLYELLYKIVLIIARLKIQPKELEFILSKAADDDMDWPDLCRLPVAAEEPAVPLEKFLHLVDAFKLQEKLFPRDTSIFEFLKMVHEEIDKFNLADPEYEDDEDIGSAVGEIIDNKILLKLSDITRWKLEDLKFLAKNDGKGGGYNFNFYDTADPSKPNEYKNEKWILKLKEAFDLIKILGAPASQVWNWNSFDVNMDQAVAIRNTVKSKYENKKWLEIAPPLRNRLRIKQRDALQAYIISKNPDTPVFDHIKNGFYNIEDLYSYYLIDPGMEPCMYTSRLKQATLSAQLFMHRILMGLEVWDDGNKVEVDKETAEQWKWRKYYRVWEANRRVFLYPENWIEPELRTDKSPFFEDLENELLQADINDDTAEEAYLNYLKKLDEVSRLEMCGFYVDEERNICHVVGRTYGTPHIYYYRRWMDKSYWTPWEKIDLDIEGDHLLPVVYNRRLYLFWPLFEEKAKENPPTKPPTKYWEIKIACSEYKDRKWVSKKVSDIIIQENFDPHYHYLKKSFHFITDKQNSTFCIILRRYFEFLFETNCKYDFSTANYMDKIIDLSTSYILYDFNYDGINYYQKFIRNAGSKLEFKISSSSDAKSNIFESILWYNAEDAPFLRQPYYFILLPFQTTYECQLPFFFEDDTRTFFAVPTGETTIIEGLGEYLGIQDIEVLPGIGILTGPDPEYQNILDTAMKESAPIEAEWRNGEINIEKYYSSNYNKSVSDHHYSRKDEKFSESAEVKPNVSFLKLADMSQNPDINFAIEQTPGFRISPNFYTIKQFTFYTFYHPCVKLFIKQLNRYGIKGLLNPVPRDELDVDAHNLDRQLAENINYFKRTYCPNPETVNMDNLPKEDIDFKPVGAYSLYNWELFFHAPFLIACRLSENQRYEEAQKWFHYIFNPTETTLAYLKHEPAELPFWKIKPFYEYSVPRSIQQIIDILTSSDPIPHDQDIIDSINSLKKWLEDPFEPHAVAEYRHVSYMRAVVMKYIENLINWGDSLFSRFTMEDINEATQLYILAAMILGPKPILAERPSHQIALDVSITDSKNVLNQIESIVPGLTSLENELSTILLNDSTDTDDNGADVLDSILSPYFYIPRNDKLLGYWKTVADRLFKIRNCMNIKGIKQELPLFEPPIDPGLLVRAAAAGVDLSTALSDMYAPLPNYRFSYVLQKAIEFCNDVKNLGSVILSALEKKDAEQLALLRSGHEIEMLKLIKEIKKQQVEEAQHTLEGLNKSKELATIRRDFYKSREFMNTSEKAYIALLGNTLVLHTVKTGLDITASISHLFPDAKAAAPTCVGTTYGGSNIGKSAEAFSGMLGTLISLLNTGGSMASTMGSYQHRQEEWDLQKGLAEKEIEQIEKQILAAEIRCAVAQNELDNQNEQIENAKEADTFMKDKFTNRQLYDWMASQISGIYFQSYQMAYALAKKAEKAFQHELAAYDTSFIEFGYWDSRKKGLLAGEKLFKDLKRMEMAYMDQNTRLYELTKHISLSFVNPPEILKLKETGSCEIDIPELLFDLDYPGHYLRRIKSVALTIPCVTGPYTSVNCKLTLLKSRTRLNTEIPYAIKDLYDPRLKIDFSGVQSIATSSGQNDTGMFEFNFRDERYLPFEGAGAVSTWKLELPADSRQFDYNTISDVILHMHYTAKDGGDGFKENVVTHINEKINTWLHEISGTETGLFKLVSLKHEYPGEWNRFLHPKATDIDQETTIRISRQHFPYFLKDKTIKIQKQIKVILKFNKTFENLDFEDIKFSVAKKTSVINVDPTFDQDETFGELLSAVFNLGEFTFTSDEPDLEIRIWTGEANGTNLIENFPDELIKTENVGGEEYYHLNPEAFDDMLLLITYTIQ